MIKYKPTTGQLNETLEHIYYEIAQITETLPLNSKNIFVNNALVEASLIHIRALLDFFQQKNRRHRKGSELDDVLSSDYGFSHCAVGIDQPYKARLNKDLAHLTYSRASRLQSDKPWPYDKVMLPILKCCEKFGKHLLSNYLPTKCPEKLPEWQALVDKIEAIQNK